MRQIERVEPVRGDVSERIELYTTVHRVPSRWSATPIFEKTGLSFSRGIRSTVRADKLEDKNRTLKKPDTEDAGEKPS